MRKLHLSEKDRKIAGVCGGLGESLGFSSDVVRIVFVLATIFGGYGILVYLALMLILPKESNPQVIDVYPEDEIPRGNMFRNPREKVIAGVCGGIADYTGWDVTIIRIAFIALAGASGIGAVIYLIMWAVMPMRKI